ncbi:hypothetical protein OAO87_03630 [bacterium]|nr:hypothetical protein [bacterium]
MITPSVAARLRHALRLGHLPDGDNFIDFATKFVSKDKEDASVAYSLRRNRSQIPQKYIFEKG